MYTVLSFLRFGFGYIGSNGRESVHSFASSSKSSRRSGWRQYRPMDTRLSSILNSHQSGASDGIEQDSDAGHEEEQEEDDEKAFEALSTRSESMAPVNKENTRAPIENPFAKLGLARGNTNAFAFFNDWSERQIQASQKLEVPPKSLLYRRPVYPSISFIRYSPLMRVLYSSI